MSVSAKYCKCLCQEHWAGVEKTPKATFTIHTVTLRGSLEQLVHLFALYGDGSKLKNLVKTHIMPH